MKIESTEFTDADYDAFIGDYFALAISNGNVYTLSVSTHYPAAGVTADDGSPIYYQQQVLAKVARAALGI
jgi:hypothetical protein